MYSREYRKSYYEKNKDRIKTYQKKWRANRKMTHPQEAVRQNQRVKEYHKTKNGKAALKAGHLNTTAKKRGQRGKVTKLDILALEENYQCATCHATDGLEFDHIVPSCKGGENTAENLQLLCKKCHKEKTKQDVSTIAFAYQQAELDILDLFNGVTNGKEKTNTLV